VIERFRVSFGAQLLAMLCVLTCAYVLAQDPAEPVFPVDDAYITQHNALALLRGTDRQFPESTPLHGATSLLHTLLVAAFAIPLSPDWALYCATWFSIGLYAWGLLELCKSLHLDVFRAFLLLASAACFGRSPHQLTNGLETGLTLAAVAWTLALETRKDALEHGKGAALLGALPFIRPELAAFSGLCLLARTIRRFYVARSTLVSGVCRDAAYFSIVFLPLLGTLWAVTGSVVPSTIGAKKLFFAEGCWNGAQKFKIVLHSFEEFAKCAGILLWLLPVILTSTIGWVCFGFIAALAYAYYESFPGALTHYEGRYLYVIAPMVLFGLARAMGTRMAGVRWAATAFAVLGIYDGITHYQERNWIRAGGRAFTAVELEKSASWVRDNLSERDVLLIHDAGYISAKTQAHLVDLVGLKTPSSVDFHEQLTWPTCGALRGTAVYEIARAHGVTHLIVLDGWERIYNIAGALRQRGFKTERVGPDGPYGIYRVTRAR
jgi:hypothetical protein